MTNEEFTLLMIRVNFKGLNNQVKQFVIENCHCIPKGALFLKAAIKKSILEKYYYPISQSRVKINHTCGYIILHCCK